MKIIEILEDFVGLFFPKVCPACGFNLFRNEKCICTRCLYHLPKTNFEKIKDNPVAMIFWGRVQIELATSFFYFNKGSKFRKLVHKLKYKGATDIGFELGCQFGLRLAESDFNTIDVIIPVPLHPEKFKKRGYNQSEYIASGIAHVLKKELNTSALVRTLSSSTQTRKTRFERWQNVENIFEVQKPNELINKHVLIVDDVITTGSTLEACAIAIKKINNTKVSIATLATA